MALNLGALVATIGADTSDLKKGRREADQELNHIRRSMDRVRVVALRLGAALAGAFAATKLISLGREALQTADQMIKLASSLGITVEQLTSLNHAANMSGVRLEEFAAASRALSRAVGEALTEETSRAARTFEALGISLQDAQGRTKDLEQILLEVGDRFSQFADGTNKTALAMNLFGEAGTKLIPMLNSGAEGIREMQREADRLGITFDTKTAEAAVRFNDNLERINRAFQGIINRVIERVLPTLENFSERLVNLTQDHEQLTKAVGSAEVALRGIAAIMIAVGGAALSLLEAVRGLWNFFSTPFSGNWEEDIAKLKKDFEGLTNTVKATVEGMKLALGFGEQAASALDGAARFAAPGLAPPTSGEGDRSGLPEAPRIRGTKEAQEDMEKLRAELDLVLDRLDGLPNLIGEAYTVNVTGFTDAMAAIDRAVQQGVLTQQEATRMKLMLTEQEQNAYKRTAQVAAQAITTLFPKSKAAAIAAAIINTAVAVTEALKLPPPLNFVQAGLVAAAGAAQIATIRSTNISGGGSSRGVSGGGGSIGPGHPYYRGGENPQGPSPQGTVITIEGIDPMKWFDGEAMRELAEKLVEVQKDGATVVFSPT